MVYMNVVGVYYRCVYREFIRCLMFLMLNTRPDLSASVKYYSRFQSNATITHWNGLKRILRYVKGTLNYGLFFQRGMKMDTPLRAYADADWASDNKDRKSTSGYFLQVYGATVSWSTRKQTTVALSSTEAEYVALANAATEVTWLKGLLKDFDIVCNEPVVIYEDNQSVIHLLNRWEHRRLKHMDVNYNYVRDLYFSK